MCEGMFYNTQREKECQSLTVSILWRNLGQDLDFDKIQHEQNIRLSSVLYRCVDLLQELDQNILLLATCTLEAFSPHHQWHYDSLRMQLLVLIICFLFSKYKVFFPTTDSLTASYKLRTNFVIHIQIRIYPSYGLNYNIGIEHCFTY